MDSGKKLLHAFDRVVHGDFPNPQRIACPGREVLLKLAQQPADTQLGYLLAHIRQCAPCFEELKELRQKKGEFKLGKVWLGSDVHCWNMLA